MNMSTFTGIMATTLCLMAILMFFPAVASAHCDTMDGPVVLTAKNSLEKSDITPVLKWIKPKHETEIREAFAKTLVVRTQGTEAKELADMYFFETLVRLHRAGEGAPYEGLKPAGQKLPAAVVEGDRALETGSVDKVIELLNHNVKEGVEQRFHKVMELKKHANDSVEAGRAYVEAYVDYIHYVEGLYMIGTGENPHGTGHATEQGAETADHAHESK